MSQEELRVTVTVDLERVQKTRDLVPALRAAGLKVDQVLDLSGIVTGSIKADMRDVLAGMVGVLAVEAEGHYQLPPPDDDIM